MRRVAPLLVALLFLPLVELLLPSSLHLTDPLRTVLLMIIVGAGVHLITGVTGILHLGIAGSMAIGAYTYAIVTVEIYPFGLGFWLGTVFAMLAACIVGVLLATPVIRLRGDYIAIVTLGFGEIVQDVLRNLEVITKGSQGINPLPGPTLGGDPWGPSNYHLWYLLLLAIVALIAIGIAWVETSPRGRRWRAIREDELAARAMGISLGREKLFAFGLGSGLAGLGGALWAALLASSGEPTNFDFQLSILILASVVIGGLGSFRGLVIGSLVLVGTTQIVIPWLGRLAPHEGIFGTFLAPENWKYALLGLALILFTRLRPQGISPEASPP